MSEGDEVSAHGWLSAPEHHSANVSITLSKFKEITNLLLERPNLNSSHLFRADIIADSAGELQTISDKERSYREHIPLDLERETASTRTRCCIDEQLRNGKATSDKLSNPDTGSSILEDAEEFAFPGFCRIRTVVRRLVPRKPQLDRPLEQSCFIYESSNPQTAELSVLVVYVPHVPSPDQMPWYHPKVRALAYRYIGIQDNASLSIHYKPFPVTEDESSSRLHRTFLSLLQTFVRLSKLDSPEHECPTANDLPISARAVNPLSLKDTILPQHIVQDTYTRLKQTYAADLIARWVEKTEPSKHVFEDLAIAAFLIELWKIRYRDGEFPGFVDIACGNGVLVYVLIREGFSGKGFDARRRKTWEVLEIDEYLEQKLCIPKPFLDVLGSNEVRDVLGKIDVHDGMFEPGTFVISNHADELTPWTPILAALSFTEAYLPFLSIPCCSHALSGAKHRYSLQDVDAGTLIASSRLDHTRTENEQPSTGDLKSLRAQKVKAASHADEKSAYACLTKKTVALAEELGFETKMTLMRIPSTRNIGIVGRRPTSKTFDGETASERVSRLLERECSTTGGLKASAQAWIERARKHIEGQGRGKVNLKRNEAAT